MDHLALSWALNATMESNCVKIWGFVSKLKISKIGMKKISALSQIGVGNAAMFWVFFSLGSKRDNLLWVASSSSAHGRKVCTNLSSVEPSLFPFINYFFHCPCGN